MKCYHTTTIDRIDSIKSQGLLPNSEPTWQTAKTPYVMLSREPWLQLNGDKSVCLEINDPSIKEDYFRFVEADGDTEGLRWPFKIQPCYIKELNQ